MNLKLSPIFIGMLLVAHTAVADTHKSTAPLKTQKEKLSYAVGLQVADSLRRDEIELDLDVVTRAIRDSMSGGKLAMTEDEKKKVIDEYRKKRGEEMKAQGEKNKKKSAEFLKENKTKKGIVTLPSGLQYKVVKEGKGKKPENDHMVTMHYRGTLQNGTEFDSSHSRGKPAEYSVTGVFPGWQEGLKNMREGSTWILYVPPELAFGEGGLGKNIPPHSVLIMEVELMKTEKLKDPDAKK